MTFRLWRKAKGPSVEAVAASASAQANLSEAHRKKAEAQRLKAEINRKWTTLVRDTWMEESE